MSTKTTMATACAALLWASAAIVLAQETNAGNEKRAQGCCMAACEHASATDGSGARHCSGTKDGSGATRCSLTGRIMHAGCCTEKDGKTHCTDAHQGMESCCCAPATDDTQESGDEAQK